MIGTMNPVFPDMQGDSIIIVNDMISAIWDESTTLAVPLVLTKGNGFVSSQRGVETPVRGLRVVTRIVTQRSENITEQAILDVKSSFKRQDFLECIEAGRSLVKLVLLGRLVTTPPRSSLKSDRGRSRDRLAEETKSTRGRRSDTHRSRSHSIHSLYSSRETTKGSVLGRLRSVLGL